MTSVCIAGAGTIGSLLARISPGHRRVGADAAGGACAALNEDGLTVTGRAEFTASVVAAVDPAPLPEPDLVIVACKGSDSSG